MNSYLKYTIFTIAISVSLSLGEGCICPAVYAPVCASNGVTFGNRCEFNCAQASQPELTVVTEGPCPNMDSDKALFEIVVPDFEEEEVPFCACSLNYNPVCGTDGTTYANLCELNCARRSKPTLEVSSYGECRNPRRHAVALPPTCICTREYRPVCASDGKTYSNKCQFNCALKLNSELTIVSNGRCGGGE